MIAYAFHYSVKGSYVCDGTFEESTEENPLRPEDGCVHLELRTGNLSLV